LCEASPSRERDLSGKVEEIQQRIGDEVGLVISAGIAQNKLLAYAAASTCEAGECIEIEPGGEREFLAPLPVSYLPGVGAKIEKRLLALGVVTIGELASIPAAMLFWQFGPIGSRLHRLAHGTDFSPVTALYPPETIIIKHTFGDMYETPCEPEAVEPYLLRMSDRVSAKLAERNRKAGMVSLRIGFENGDSVSRSHVPKSAISSAHEIYSAARRILRTEMHGTEVVSIGLTLSDLRAVGGFQLDFLDDPERRMRIQALFGRIHARFGEKALIYGAALSA
jgi:DNA polymerase-4